VSLDTLEALTRAALDGRAGVFVRFGAASSVYAALTLLWRRTLSAEASAWAQVATSLVLLSVLTSPLVSAALVVHAVALFAVIERLPPGRARALLIGGLLAVHAAMPVLWFPALPGYAPHVREFVAFATNAGLLRAWAWVRDRPRLRQRGIALARDYAFYTFFLPAFVNGPFFSPAELDRRRLHSDRTSPPPAGPSGAYALRRILTGVVEALAAMALIDTFTSGAYRAAASGSSLHAWRHALAVYVCFYLGFGAWTEASIGFACLAGIRLPENFDRPHLSYGLADFWRRWNVTLGRWMLQYIYLPLAPHGGPTRAFAWYGPAAVFSSVAAYHYLGGLKLLGPAVARLPGFWIPWIAWVALNTVGVRLTQSFRAPEQWTVRFVLVAIATVGTAALGMMVVFFPVDLPLDLLRVTIAHMVIPHW